MEFNPLISAQFGDGWCTHHQVGEGGSFVHLVGIVIVHGNIDILAPHEDCFSHGGAAGFTAGI